MNVLVPFLMHSQDLCITLYNFIFQVLLSFKSQSPNTLPPFTTFPAKNAQGIFLALYWKVGEANCVFVTETRRTFIGSLSNAK